MSVDAPVLNHALPDAPWLDPARWRLPGTTPLDPAHWLFVSDAFAGQMHVRERLLDTRLTDVHAVLPECEQATSEVLGVVLDALRCNPRYKVGSATVRRPDGITVPIDPATPLVTAARLIQEDLCILQPGADGTHRLTGAVLCFPASWSLHEKIGRSLTGLHAPIDAYTPDVARRVQRMFDGLREGVLLTRSNALIYKTPQLFLPRSEAEHGSDVDSAGGYLRSERQTLRLLPRTGAVLFTIHTFVVRVDDLTEEQIRSFDQVRNRKTSA